MYNCGDITSSGDDMKIIGNRLTGGYAGIYIDNYCEYLKIYNNYICNVSIGLFNNDYDFNQPENELYHNSFYTSGSCLYFANSAYYDWNIRNNILYTTANTTTSACIKTQYTIGSSSPLEQCNYNLFYAPNGARIAITGSTNYSTLASWQADDYCATSTNDPNSMNKVPAYQNAASCDLDLVKDVTNYPYPGQAWDGYPQGQNLSSVGTDINGTIRTEPTIGAFEYNSPLPITLLSFDAMLRNRMVELSWITASEKNNDYFIIERSHNGSDWEFLDQVDGAGNSTELLSYQTYDFNPYRGITYYRLKQVDFDGNYSYSEIRSVANTDDLMILPNPSTGIFGIGGMPKHQENTIAVLDITGKVLEQHATEEESFQLDLTQRSAGVYMVIINGTESIKVIKE
jgi:hypothetical protein